MSGIKFDLTTESLNQLQKLIDVFDDVQPALHVIGRTMLTRINLGFKTATDPWGMAWKPLAIRQGQPLRDTGKYQRSHTYNLIGDGVEIGTNATQARLQHFGGWVTPRTAKALRFYASNGAPIFSKAVYIPARPAMPILPNGQAVLPTAWEQATLKALQKHFESKMS